jgi:sugar (pentulose or hexulose) kinase
VQAGQLAVILGNSAVVNSSSNDLPAGDGLDAMRLNWGPYLWMRCYNNGAQFLDRVVGPNPDWQRLEPEASAFAPGSNGVNVMPFALAEPSLGITAPRVEWQPREPGEPGRKYRASLEALAYLIALGVEAHEKAGQKISRITVSGGIARSDLMCRILASVLGRPLHRLLSFEGPALGAAVTALSAIETHRRRAHGEGDAFSVNDAIGVLVRFRDVVQPVSEWREPYRAGLDVFAKRLRM